MKRLIVFILLLFVSITISSQEKKIKLAIIPFDDTLTLSGELENSGNIAFVSLQNSIKEIERFYLRDQNAIREYLDILIQVQAGIKKPESLKSKSNNLKVDYLIVGTVSKLNNQYEVDVRVIDVKTWIIVHAHGSSSKDLQKAINDIEWYIDKKFNRKYLASRSSGVSEKPAVTVYNFKDYSSKFNIKSYSGAFSEILNSQLGSFQLISTIESKFTKALVEEKVLEMTGVINNDDSDENFFLNGIKYKIIGDVRNFKDFITINYKIINTEDSRVVFCDSKDVKTSKSLRTLAWDISTTVEDVLMNRIGELKINSKPGSAKIYIDEEYMGETPLKISLPKGKHILKLKKSRYKTIQQNIDIKAKQITNANLKLEKINFDFLEKAFMAQKKGDLAKALKYYEKFIEKYNDSQESNVALYQKGHLLLKELQKYNEALIAFQDLVQKCPETMLRSQAYYGIIISYKALGKKKKAKESLQYLIKNYKNSMAAQEAINIKL